MSLLKRIWLLYYDGFRNMTVGKRLWVIILVKIFILFFVLRLFFFPDFLSSRFHNIKEKGDYVGRELIERNH